MIKGNELLYYCAQSTEYAPADLDDFMMTYTSDAFKTRELLHIDEGWIGLWDTLSHGERKRLQLGCALFSDCDVLMVDEPSNHLDETSQEIVFNALKNFKGIGILVSHDRRLLDELCQHTMILKAGEISHYKSSFSIAMQAHRQKDAHLRNTKEAQDNTLKKLKKTMQQQQEKVDKSTARLSKKGLSSGDNAKKEKINLAILTGKDKNDGQLLKRTQTQHDQLSKKSVKVTKEYTTGISFDLSQQKHYFPVIINEGVLTLGEKSLRFPRLSIEAEDRIGIRGVNGAGKSSFLSHLLSDLSFRGEFLYIPQEISDEESETLFSYVSGLGDEEKGELFTLIQRLASDPKRLLQSSVPSPGEIRKLLIALGLLKKPSLIILDEPSNHMDLISIEALETALDAYCGALLIISHDRVFLDKLTQIYWTFTEDDKNNFHIEETI